MKYALATELPGCRDVAEVARAAADDAANAPPKYGGDVGRRQK